MCLRRGDFKIPDTLTHYLVTTMDKATKKTVLPPPSSFGLPTSITTATLCVAYRPAHRVCLPCWG